jgi:hypothetical protein
MADVDVIRCHRFALIASAWMTERFPVLFSVVLLSVAMAVPARYMAVLLSGCAPLQVKSSSLVERV